MDFGNLLPEIIFKAVMAQGFTPTGVLYPLNSYENRVYEVRLEESEPIIAKFYRPGRWSADQIAEEHGLLDLLTSHDVPVVPALKLKTHLPGKPTLAVKDGLFYAFFPKFRGREHDEITDEDRLIIGRLLGRLHQVSVSFPVRYRPRLDPTAVFDSSLETILDFEFLPDDLRDSLENLLVRAARLVIPRFDIAPLMMAVHGDCHPGNILWNDKGPHLVDFDDMMVAPPVQDVWMLFNGRPEEVALQKKIFLEGYETFASFDTSTFSLSEPLRTLRMVRHAAWIGGRYHEPIFTRTFPYYRERRYWEQFLLAIREQIGALQEGL